VLTPPCRLLWGKILVNSSEVLLTARRSWWFGVAATMMFACRNRSAVHPQVVPQNLCVRVHRKRWSGGVPAGILSLPRRRCDAP
jgi:hypothetical protein